jgi:cobalt-zinc-cadmium efflux system protein
MEQPANISSGLMLVVAVVGAAANAIGLLILRRGQKESLNLRGAYLEVLGDLFGAVAVVIAAVVISLTGYTRADSIASIASIAIFVLSVPRVWSLLREVVDVLLEAAPRGVDLNEVCRHIEDVRGVVGVHDLNAWAITSGVPVLSATSLSTPPASPRAAEVLDRLGESLGDYFRRRPLHLPTRTRRPPKPRSPVSSLSGLPLVAWRHRQ